MSNEPMSDEQLEEFSKSVERWTRKEMECDDYGLDWCAPDLVAEVRRLRGELVAARRSADIAGKAWLEADAERERLRAERDALKAENAALRDACHDMLLAVEYEISDYELEAPTGATMLLSEALAEEIRAMRVATGQEAEEEE